MDEVRENRFGYLRALTDEDKLNMISELEDDIKSLQEIIENPNISSEQRSESYSEITYDNERIEYLKSILNEKAL
jgi:F0F1-type ATP synthase delta subunit